MESPSPRECASLALLTTWPSDRQLVIWAITVEKFIRHWCEIFISCFPLSMEPLAKRPLPPYEVASALIDPEILLPPLDSSQLIRACSLSGIDAALLIVLEDERCGSTYKMRIDLVPHRSSSTMNFFSPPPAVSHLCLRSLETY